MSVLKEGYVLLTSSGKFVNYGQVSSVSINPKFAVRLTTNINKATVFQNPDQRADAAQLVLKEHSMKCSKVEAYVVVSVHLGQPEENEVQGE